MLYIGMDLGTSAVKLLLIDGSERIHKVVPRGYPLYFLHPGWSEQNPEDWLTASMDGMKELTSECDKSQVIGISFRDQIHGLVTLDETDKVIRPIILWDDGRFKKKTDYLSQNVGRNKLSAYTANIAFTGFTVPKIPWMRKNEPKDFAHICGIMLPKGYLAYRLSGSFCTDYSDASDMLLLDVTHKCWSEEMMEICGITRKQLPDSYEGCQVVGDLKEGLAEELGSTQDVKIIAGAEDNAAAAVGIGTVGKGCCNISLGTSRAIFISNESFKVDCNNALHSFDHADGHFHLMGCMLSAVSCNKWWMKEILKTKEFSGEQEGIVRLGENHVFYLPYLMGKYSPHNDPRAKACFIGMTMDTSRGEMTRAVLGGVVFGLRDSLEVARSLGIRIDHTKICGMGAKSPLRRKTVANTMNVKMDVVGNEEGLAPGGAILVAVGCGKYPDVKTAADGVVKIVETIEPDAGLAGRYEKQYGRFGQIHPALKMVFQSPEE